MNKFFCFLLLMIFHNCYLIAQSYFPTGAIWTYHAPDATSASFTTIESMGDSVFDGDTLTYLHGYVQCADGQDELVKQIGEKIYKLNKCDSSFSLLYDFDASTGDTLVLIDICQFNDTIRLNVDSISQISINGSILN